MTRPSTDRAKASPPTPDCEAFYGLTVVNPAMHAQIIAPPPPTLWDFFVDFWDEIFFPSFIFACAFTAFTVAFR